MEKERLLAETRIQNIIKSIRQDAREYLRSDGGVDLRGNNFESLPIQKIFSKLRKDKTYRKKREIKLLQKGSISGNLADRVEQLKQELAKVDGQIKGIGLQNKTKKDLKKVLAQYEQILGLDKRVCSESFDKSLAEVDG